MSRLTMPVFPDTPLVLTGEAARNAREWAYLWKNTVGRNNWERYLVVSEKLSGGIRQVEQTVIRQLTNGR